MTTSRKVLTALAGFAVLLTVAAFTTRGSSVIQSMKPLLVRNVDAPATRAFQVGLCVESNQQVCAPDAPIIALPATTSAGEPVKRIVIEHASAWCAAASTGYITSMFIETSVNGIEAFHYFAPAVGAAPSSFLTATPTRIYADPGTDVRLFAGITASSGWCKLTISGHLVVE